MTKRDIFVGRREELKEFARILEDPRGQAILVVGQSGMGKTLLVNEMVRRAEKGILSEKTKDIKVWSIRYEITPDAAATSTMERVIIDASALASPIKRKLGMAGEHREKWKALFGGAGVIPVFGQSIKAAGEAILSLCQNKERDTKRKFIETLRKLSECMADSQRAIFVIDPEKRMPQNSDDAWKLVVRELPDKIKLVFPQRPDDVLVSSRQFCGLKNVVRVPRGKVEELDAGAIDDLVSGYAARTGRGANELHNAVTRYKRHPYAVAAALTLIEDGLAIEELPMDPTPEKIVEEQLSWAFKKGPNAVKLLEAYAVLEVTVPDEVVEKVSGVAPAARKALLEDNYLGGLLREEADGRRIYHSILADHILRQINNEEKKEYDNRAVEVYRGKLGMAKRGQTKPEELAAIRLPEHLLAMEGKEAFVEAVENECVRTLSYLERLMLC